MVGVNLDIAPGGHLQVEEAVPGERFQHVVQKRDGRVDAALALAVQVDLKLDLGLGGVSDDFRGAWGPRFYATGAIIIIPDGKAVS